MIFALALSYFLSSVPASKILILGDSLTAGYGLREEQAYPVLLEKRLVAAGQPYTVLNGGISGDTTAGGLRRLPWMLKNAAPDFVVIALGANDMLRGLPTQKAKENLKRMLDLVKKEKIPVALLGIHAPENLGATYVQSFNRLYDDLAREEKVPLLHNYISDVAGKWDLNLRDGIHPNSKGHQIIAENLFQFLNPLLRKVQK